MDLKFILIFFLAIDSFSSIAQTADLVFIGAASLDNKVSYSYKLSLTDSNGILSGYSVMDLLGPNETKTAVKGKIDLAKKELTFSETHIISTKSNAPKNTFCYIYARTKIIKKQKSLCLSGTFTGYEENRKTKCAQGKILLYSAQDLLDKLTKMAGQRDTLKDPLLTIEKIEEKKIVYEEATTIDRTKIYSVDPGKTIELMCEDNHVKLSIWDDKTVDGDVITLLQNNTVLLDKHRLTGIYKDVNLTIANPSSDTIKIIAISEGSEPMNTARVKLTSGNDTRYIDASSTLDKPVYIILKRKK